MNGDDRRLLPRWRDVALDHREAAISPQVEKALRESSDDELAVKPGSLPLDHAALRGVPV